MASLVREERKLMWHGKPAAAAAAAAVLRSSPGRGVWPTCSYVTNAVRGATLPRRGVGVQVVTSETNDLKALYFQEVETKWFQPGVNLMSTCTALPRSSWAHHSLGSTR